MKISKVNLFKTAQDTFTDREAPRKSFWDLYRGMEPGEAQVLNFYGVGGIGKTTLLRKLQKEMQETESIGEKYSLYYNLENGKSKNEILLDLAKMLKKKFPEFDFSVFLYAYMMCVEKNGEEAGALRREMKETFFDSSGFDQAASVAGVVLPYTGTVATVAKATASVVKAAMTKYKRELGEDKDVYQKIDGSAGNELSSELHQYFAYDAYRNFEKLQKPFAMMLDGYEILVNKLADGEQAKNAELWIRGEEGLVQTIPNVLWVIAGREKLEWPEEILPSNQKHLIGNLSEEDSTSFFQKSGVKDTVLCHELYELTTGTPVYMDLCIRKYLKILNVKGNGYHPTIEEFGKNTEELAVRYLRDMDLGEQMIVHLLSCLPDAWDDEMVNAVAADISYDRYLEKYNLVKELSLVEKLEDDCYKVHETFRVVVEQNIREEEKQIIYAAVGRYLVEAVKKSKFQNKRLEYYIRSAIWLLDKRQESICGVTNSLDILVDGIRELGKAGDYENCIWLADSLHEAVRKRGLSRNIEIRCDTRKAYMLYKLQRYEEAKAFGEQVYAHAAESLSPNDIVRLDLEYALVCAYFGMKDYEKAKKLAEALYEKRKAVSGITHRDTLMVLSGIAAIYDGLGGYQEAVKIETEVYQLRKKTLGECDVETICSLGNLATYYSKTGDVEKTLEMDKAVMRIRKKILGEQHPDTISAKENLEWSESRKNGSTDGERRAPILCASQMPPADMLSPDSKSGDTAGHREISTAGMKYLLLVNKTDCEQAQKVMSGNVIGRDTYSADIIFNRQSISRKHCRIDYTHGEWYITDLGSTNGVKVNGVRISANQPEKIIRGDEVAIADLTFKVEG